MSWAGTPPNRLRTSKACTRGRGATSALSGSTLDHNHRRRNPKSAPAGGEGDDSTRRRASGCSFQVGWGGGERIEEPKPVSLTSACRISHCRARYDSEMSVCCLSLACWGHRHDRGPHCPCSIKMREIQRSSALIVWLAALCIRARIFTRSPRSPGAPMARGEFWRLCTA